MLEAIVTRHHLHKDGSICEDYKCKRKHSIVSHRLPTLRGGESGKLLYNHIRTLGEVCKDVGSYILPNAKPLSESLGLNVLWALKVHRLGKGYGLSYYNEGEWHKVNTTNILLERYMFRVRW